MKKPLVLTLAGVLAIGGTSAALASTGGSNQVATEPVLTLQSSNSPITEQDAKKIAEDFIGGKVTDIEKDTDDGVVYYEVEVDLNGEDYDLDILEENGQIIDADGNLLRTDASSSAAISQEDAEAAAKEAVSMDTVIKTDLEIENGQYVYEVEFNVNGDGEDVKVNGETGEIISIDDDFNLVVQQDGELISAEEAKAIAIKEVGDQSNVTEIDLDTDDGLSIYELELNVNGVEYDVDINAVTKEVIKVEKD
ncbi:PepSY domain-containing protein [Alkalicoccobacillus murimartini]|uniref:Membrane protein YkoI n=1 Tax=Alkalicoccobacillus murimartini TaxID=171685 RepID=A0ABT9YN26_9BACI|nr:PepSY domain-containing protein [Alkalicoccobacillus murimartini]MDQ0208993.1 putative membrane protein YkoI [Alkalicoccobacillus murimartini]